MWRTSFIQGGTTIPSCRSPACVSSLSSMMPCRTLRESVRRKNVSPLEAPPTATKRRFGELLRTIAVSFPRPTVCLTRPRPRENDRSARQFKTAQCSARSSTSAGANHASHGCPSIRPSWRRSLGRFQESKIQGSSVDSGQHRTLIRGQRNASGGPHRRQQTCSGGKRR